MKKLIISPLIILIISFFATSASAQEAKKSPAPEKTCVYMFSAPGYGTISGSPLRKRITCRGGEGICWGIGSEDGRLYIDIFDRDGNIQSYWINSMPLHEEDDPEGASNWVFDSAGEKN